MADCKHRYTYTMVAGNFHNWYYQEWVKARDLYSELGEWRSTMEDDFRPGFEQGDKILVLFSDGSNLHGTIDSIPLDCGDMWRIITQNVDGVKLLLALIRIAEI